MHPWAVCPRQQIPQRLVTPPRPAAPRPLPPCPAVPAAQSNVGAAWKFKGICAKTFTADQINTLVSTLKTETGGTWSEASAKQGSNADDICPYVTAVNAAAQCPATAAAAARRRLQKAASGAGSGCGTSWAFLYL